MATISVSGGGATSGGAPGGAAGGSLAGTYPNPTVAASAITTTEILDGTIANADIDPAAAIAGTKLGALTGDVTKASGSAATVLAAGSAANLNSGTLGAARLPALTGDVTTSAGSAATTLATGSAANLNSGTLLAARMPALTGDITTSAGAVATSIATGAVTSTHILDGTILNADIAPAAAIARSKLATCTRQFWIPGAVMGVTGGDGPSNATVGAFQNAVRVIALADAASNGIQTNFAVPNDWASGVVTYTIYWAPGSTDASAHTVQWSMDVYEAVAGADLTTTGTTTAWTGASAARTASFMVVEAAQTLLTPATVGNLVRVSLRRLGSDALDTYVGVVNVVGVLFAYTASQ